MMLWLSCLMHLTNNQKNCSFGLYFLYLRNIKGFGWNHKCVYTEIYKELALNIENKV